MEVAGIVLAVLFCLFLAVYLWLHLRARREQALGAWQALAQELGLRYTPGNLWRQVKAEGEVRGYSVSIADEAHLENQQHSVSTRIRTGFQRPLALGLKLARAGALSGLGKLLGSQDIQLGNHVFDRAFIVQGQDPDQIFKLFSPRLQQACLRYDRDVGPLMLDDKGLSFEAQGLVSDKQRLRKIIDAQIALVSDIEWCRQQL